MGGVASRYADRLMTPAMKASFPFLLSSSCILGVPLSSLQKPKTFPLSKFPDTSGSLNLRWYTIAAFLALALETKRTNGWCVHVGSQIFNYTEVLEFSRCYIQEIVRLDMQENIWTTEVNYIQRENILGYLSAHKDKTGTRTCQLISRRQRGRVVRAPDLKFVGREFKSRSDR